MNKIDRLKISLRQYRAVVALDAIRAQRQFQAWQRAGRPIPPPQRFKQRVLIKVGAALSLRTLIETGTYMGDTVEVTRHHFDHVNSIEISAEIHRLAKIRFRDIANVRLFVGDSRSVLQQVLATLHEPALFWLDGHYSGPHTGGANVEAPILDEIRQIAAHEYAPEHCILIDDARLFIGDREYPSVDTLQAAATQLGFAHFACGFDLIAMSARPLSWPTLWDDASR